MTIKHKVTVLKSQKSGTLESAYIGTLMTLDNLMMVLNEMEKEGLLPRKGPLAEKLNNCFESVNITMCLAALHYPKMKFGMEN